MPYKDVRNKLRPWVGQFKREGKKYRKSFATRKEALEWEKLSQQEEIQIVTVSLEHWANCYLDYAKQQFVEKTYEEKVFAFRQLFQHRRIKPELEVALLTPLIVLDHIQQQEKARSGNAANKDRKNLRAAWSWGTRFLNMPRENPFSAVEKCGESRFPRVVPGIADFLSVYSVATTDQDKCMLLCYLHTGARREELFRLRWVDVDFINRKIRLFWRKNKLGTWKNVWLNISDDMVSMLREQHERTGKEKFVFLTEYSKPYLKRQHWLKNLCEKAGVKQFGFHGIRHLTASLLAERNIPLVEIQHHLRHDHLSTTERYIHQLQKNRVAIDALPGLEDASEK
ncbi:MAG: site-specific integrase [Desulfobulbus sp.]|nr:site-specific integrase [Desulfobulbus sp.]